MSALDAMNNYLLDLADNKERNKVKTSRESKKNISDTHYYPHTAIRFLDKEVLVEKDISLTKKEAVKILYNMGFSEKMSNIITNNLGRQ